MWAVVCSQCLVHGKRNHFSRTCSYGFTGLKQSTGGGGDSIAPSTVGAGVRAWIVAGATGEGVGRKEILGADVGEKVSLTEASVGAQNTGAGVGRK